MRQRMVTIFCLLLVFAGPIRPQGSQDILNAVNGGDVELVKTLLAKDPALIKTKDRYQNNLLRLAIIQRNLPLAELLIQGGIDVNEGREDTGGNALFDAVAVGSLDIAKLVLKHGVNLQAKNRAGNTVLNAAVNQSNKVMADFLLEQGVNLNLDGVPIGRTLRNAVAGGLEKVVGMIEQSGKPIDYLGKDEFGASLLHAAALGGMLNFADKLVKQGLGINDLDVFGWSPLHHAASRGRLEFVDGLIARGADRNLRDNGGMSPYNVASEFGQNEMAAALEKRGVETKGPVFPALGADTIDPIQPGASRRIFAPGIVSRRDRLEHSAFVFSGDMSMACWSDGNRTDVARILWMEKKNGRWTSPVVVLSRAARPCFSADGKRMIFMAPRILPDGKRTADDDLFVMERKDDGWGTPVNLGPNVNTDVQEASPSISHDDTLYFESGEDIYRSRCIKGVFAPREKLPLAKGLTQPFIARDESFLLVKGLGMSPAKIVYRRSDDTWSALVEFNDRVDTQGALFPSVTPDARFFFMAAGEYFWIEAKFIDELRPADKLPQSVCQ